MPARIALLHVLYMAPFREEVFFAPAEDIGYFEPMFPHRSGGMAVAQG
jgi:hypothetical protein